MKKIFLLLPLLLLFSCSIQKRKYQKGYYVNWHNNHTQTDKLAKTDADKKRITDSKPYNGSTEVSENKQEELTVSAKNDFGITEHIKTKKQSAKDEPCDLIIFKDGSEVSAKVSEITSTEVKYKKCEMEDGPNYVVKKSELFMIKYANGTREVFKNETPQKPVYENNTRSQVNGPQKNHPYAILALVFGILGIYPLTIIGSILAIIFAGMAIKKIRENPELYKGEGLAIAGRILGIIMLSLLVLFVIIAFLILMAAI